MPNNSPLPSLIPSSQNQQFQEKPDLNIDLNQGPFETLQSIFPNTNFLAPVTLDNHPMQEPVSAVNVPTGLSSFTSPINNNGFTSQVNIPETATLNWDEWDQVMRDFQMDVENDGSDLGKGTHVTEWFA